MVTNLCNAIDKYEAALAMQPEAGYPRPSLRPAILFGEVSSSHRNGGGFPLAKDESIPFEDANVGLGGEVSRLGGEVSPANQNLVLGLSGVDKLSGSSVGPDGQASSVDPEWGQVKNSESKFCSNSMASFPMGQGRGYPWAGDGTNFVGEKSL
jgi:hypothetical protein